MRREQPWLTNRSRALRASATSAEAILWSRLRSRRLNGFKFVRQEPLGPYFADFVCRDRRLIVEVDGGTHGESHEAAVDAARMAALEKLGYRIVRVSNGDVYDNIDGVLETVLAVLDGPD